MKTESIGSINWDMLSEGHLDNELVKLGEENHEKAKQMFYSIIESVSGYAMQKDSKTLFFPQAHDETLDYFARHQPLSDSMMPALSIYKGLVNSGNGDAEELILDKLRRVVGENFKCKTNKVDMKLLYGIDNGDLGNLILAFANMGLVMGTLKFFQPEEAIGFSVISLILISIPSIRMLYDFGVNAGTKKEIENRACDLHYTCTKLKEKYTPKPAQEEVILEQPLTDTGSEIRDRKENRMFEVTRA